MHDAAPDPTERVLPILVHLKKLSAIYVMRAKNCFTVCRLASRSKAWLFY